MRHQELTAPEVSQASFACISVGAVPFIQGSPGIGKSAVARALAEEYNLELIDMRLSQCDPTDLLGFPTVEGGRGRYAPMETFPLEGDVLPEGKDGWLLFLDEFNSTERATQKAAYKLVLDKQVGKHRLHKNVAIIAAGNLETDNAIVEEMGTAMQSRIVWLKMVSDTNAWLEWAMTHGIHHQVCAYIKFKPQNLNNFDPNHSDRTFACARTWEVASKLLKNMGEKHPLLLTVLAGTIGQGVAHEFVTFLKIYSELPDPATVLANPLNAPVPSEPSHMFALTGSLAHHVTETTIDGLMKYLIRMPAEFQVVCLKETCKRNKKLFSTKPVQDWIAKQSINLF